MTSALLLVAMSMSAEVDFQMLLDGLRQSQDVPGISAVVTRGDDVIYAGASGVADIESGRALSADTVLYCGSLSKVFTAVLVMQLVEQGKLELSDTVAGIATASAAPAIAVGQLLTHTSGLEREGDFGYWFSADFPDTDDLADYLQNTRLRFAPGSRRYYSNIGFAKLGLVAADAAGQSYADALRTRVLQPLGLNSTGSGRPPKNLSSGYTPTGRLLPNDERPFAGVGHAVGDRRIREYHNARAMTPAFGLHTTANDLSRLLRFLLGHGGNDVLSAATRQRMRSRQVFNSGYGLRIAEVHGQTVARHGGWFAAHRSHLLLDVENDIAVAILANSDSAAPEAIAEALYEMALAAGSE